MRLTADRCNLEYSQISKKQRVAAYEDDYDWLGADMDDSNDIDEKMMIIEDVFRWGVEKENLGSFQPTNAKLSTNSPQAP